MTLLKQVFSTLIGHLRPYFTCKTCTNLDFWVEKILVPLYDLNNLIKHIILYVHVQIL